MNFEPMWFAAILACALLWDLLLGELPNALHPVAWVGHVMAAWKRVAPRAGWIALVAGSVFALGLPFAFAFCIDWLLLALAAWPWGAALVALFLLQATFAFSGLFRAGNRVRASLAQGELGQARVGLGGLCSRDASELSAVEIETATVESLAENSSDSFVAPLFWLGLFGIPGAVFYRVANTADAMLGYRGDLELAGKAAARLDDALNLIPARITGFAMIAASSVVRLNRRGAWKVLMRDRGATTSPNAGWPMAAAAGALDTVLEKRGVYSLGESLVAGEELAPGELIMRGTQLSRVASLIGGALGLVLGLGLRWFALGAGGFYVAG